MLIQRASLLDETLVDLRVGQQIVEVADHLSVSVATVHRMVRDALLSWLSVHPRA